MYELFHVETYLQQRSGTEWGKEPLQIHSELDNLARKKDKENKTFWQMGLFLIDY